jgi:hypothetical protein
MSLHLRAILYKERKMMARLGNDDINISDNDKWICMLNTTKDSVSITASSVEKYTDGTTTLCFEMNKRIEKQDGQMEMDIVILFDHCVIISFEVFGKNFKQFRMKSEPNKTYQLVKVCLSNPECILRVVKNADTIEKITFNMNSSDLKWLCGQLKQSVF